MELNDIKNMAKQRQTFISQIENLIDSKFDLETELERQLEKAIDGGVAIEDNWIAIAADDFEISWKISDPVFVFSTGPLYRMSDSRQLEEQHEPEVQKIIDVLLAVFR